MAVNASPTYIVLGLVGEAEAKLLGWFPILILLVLLVLLVLFLFLGTDERVTGFFATRGSTRKIASTKTCKMTVGARLAGKPLCS